MGVQFNFSDYMVLELVYDTVTTKLVEVLFSTHNLSVCNNWSDIKWF